MTLAGAQINRTRIAATGPAGVIARFAKRDPKFGCDIPIFSPVQTRLAEVSSERNDHQIERACCPALIVVTGCKLIAFSERLPCRLPSTCLSGHSCYTGVFSGWALASPVFVQPDRTPPPTQATEGTAKLRYIALLQMKEDTHPMSSDASIACLDASDSLAAEAGSVELEYGNVADSPVRFGGLDLDCQVLSAVETAGYDQPTVVQKEVIPHLLAGRDVLVQSQTGTGKTAAFALPILSRLQASGTSPQVLVLTPTRELAIQVARSFNTYAQNISSFRVVAIYGGQDYEPQLRALRRGVQVVVGTPGRVIDHIRRGSLDLGTIKTLVLDEADEMLNMGFAEDVQFVLQHLPGQRQTALFSATLPEPIRRIAAQYLDDPVRMTIKSKTMTAASIRQRAIVVRIHDKLPTLRNLLEVENTDGVIVFTKTREATLTVAESLQHHGFRAAALNGDMPQKTRERTIQQFKSGGLDVLVATDVAARGLDVARVSHVFNFDLPHDTEAYVHRIGRTGRAGRSGEAILFLSPAQRGRLKQIERITKQPIELIQAPTVDTINTLRIQRFQEQIRTVAGSADLSLYSRILSEHAQRSGQPMESIAAALAHIGQQGRPFLLSQAVAVPAKKHRQADRSGQASRASSNRKDAGRHQAAGSTDFADEPNRFAGRNRGVRGASAPEPGMARYRVEVGKRDGMQARHLVGAIANEAGIAGNAIGPIKIETTFSLVDLPEALPRGVVQTLRNTWILGRQLRLRPWETTSGRAKRDPLGKPSHRSPKPGGMKRKPKKVPGSTLPSAVRRQKPRQSRG